MKQIKSIEVKDSPFFEDFQVGFSEKLNCLMGGRGTGKSTLLYFLKSCLFPEAEENKIVRDILRGNLGSGLVTIHIESDDGSEYQITKSYNDVPNAYKLPSMEYVHVDKILEGIECDFFETGDIENIGRIGEERLTLIDKKIKNEVMSLRNEIANIQSELDLNAKDIQAQIVRQKKITSTLDQYKEIEDEFNSHKENAPKSLKDDDKSSFEKADKQEKVRKGELRFFNKAFSFIDELENDIKFKKGDSSESLDSLFEDVDGFINKETIQPAIDSTKQGVKEILGKYDEILSQIAGIRRSLNETHQNLSKNHDKQHAQFIQLKEKFEKNREYINVYHKLSKRLDEKKTLEKDFKEIVKKEKKLIALRESLLERFYKVRQEIYDLRLKTINELNETFDGEVLITLKFGGLTKPFEEALREGLTGSGLQYNSIISSIVNNLTPDEFAELVLSADEKMLSKRTNVDLARSQTVVEKLQHTELIYSIQTLYCHDLPDFLLKVNPSSAEQTDYRKSDELSMGQRCTTVLPIIFGVSNNPLIIDQPEDNLDNRFITTKIHQIIREQKSKRQLIFITHNPNIPVLGDSEQNIFLEYDKKSKLHSQGRIDEVKDDIIQLLEGGTEAFTRRKDTYGI
jgi:ABC-type lipoprotein export system ATPase subunit